MLVPDPSSSAQAVKLVTGSPLAASVSLPPIEPSASALAGAMQNRRKHATPTAQNFDLTYASAD
jgi:hypothetical protein